VFNFLNITNLQNPISALNNPNFGKVRVGATGQTGDPRVAQFAAEIGILRHNAGSMAGAAAFQHAVPAAQRLGQRGAGYLAAIWDGLFRASGS
jgi:hypothetical protein